MVLIRFLVTEEAFFHFIYFLFFPENISFSVVVCAWIHTLDYLRVCSLGRQTLRKTNVYCRLHVS